MERRKEILLILGNKCSNPFNLPHPDWLNAPELLQIDHINGGGNKERLSLPRNRYLDIIAKKLKEGNKDYQLLCPACNWKKAKENKEFLHIPS